MKYLIVVLLICLIVVFMTKERSLMLQALNPSYSTCHRCGLPWNHCEPRVVWVTARTGSFALCTQCWDESDLDERLTFYKGLYYEQRHHYPDLPDKYTLDELVHAVTTGRDQPL